MWVDVVGVWGGWGLAKQQHVQTCCLLLLVSLVAAAGVAVLVGRGAGNVQENPQKERRANTWLGLRKGEGRLATLIPPVTPVLKVVGC